MNLPGFGAAASLRRTTTSYQTVAGDATASARASVIPALRPLGNVIFCATKCWLCEHGYKTGNTCLWCEACKSG